MDATNPFISPNQTLADIIPDRNLGPLASLKITDADLIISNLNSQLNAAVEKNDQSTALLRRMDQRQKEIEAELAALKAEKDAAIQEKRDHTINQERLAENIRDNLEKEYADKEQNYVWQLKQELRAKTSTIRDQCKMEFDQELKKLKEEWNQEHLKTNEQHNVQISQVLKEIDALKEHSSTQQKAEVVEPGDKISDLKTTAFDFVPGTVNTKRGGAVNLHEETILWSKNEDAPPIAEAPLSREQQSHFIDLIYDYKEVFSLYDGDLGFCDALKHSIPTTTDKPVYLPHQQIPVQLQQEVRKCLESWLKQGIIRPSKSPYASQVVIVRKKSGEIRPCINFRKLNAISIRDSFPLPRIEEALQAVQAAVWFTSFDLA